MNTESGVSKITDPNLGHITKLALKAIQNKKSKNTLALNIKKDFIECDFFSKFDLLERFISKNGQTSLYHLAKSNDPTQQFCCKVRNTKEEDTKSDIFEKIKVPDFSDEAYRLALSQHPNVMRFIESGLISGTPYMLSEWALGQSLSKIIQTHEKEEFLFHHIALLIRQLASALEHMHSQGVCHLDIKPSNIIVCDDDTVKLIDFGSSRYTDKPETHIDVSLKYASPLYLGSGIAKTQDDVYSLGMLTAHLFLGASFNDEVYQNIIKGIRPSRIPQSVWQLIKSVIFHPRTHPYSAVSFSKKLSSIQLSSYQVNHKKKGAIFKSTREDAFPRLTLPAFFFHFKYILVVLFLASFTYSIPEYNKRKTLKNEIPPPSPLSAPSLEYPIKQNDLVSFLSQSPWEQKNTLAKISDDIPQLHAYQKAYKEQTSIFSQAYLKEEPRLSLQQKSAKTLFAQLAEIRAGLVSLKESLKKENPLSTTTESAFISMMNALNKADATSSQITQYINLNEEALAELLLKGNVPAVDEYLKAAWRHHHSNAYFYSQVVSTRLLEQLTTLANQDAKIKDHTQAIKSLEAAMLFLGNSPSLREKTKELTIAKNEHLLFSTLTEKEMHPPEQLRKALQEIKILSPEKFNEVVSLLTQISANAIEQSHKKTIPAQGALAVLSALNENKLEEKKSQKEQTQKRIQK